MPTLRGSVADNPTGSGPNTVALPSGTLSSDLVVVLVSVDGPTGTVSWSAPGMTQVAAVTNLSGSVSPDLAMGVLVGTGFTTDRTVTCSDAGLWQDLLAMSWIDADESTFLVGTAGEGDGTSSSVVIPGITTTVNNAEVLVFAGATFGGSGTTTSPSSTLLSNVGGGSHSRVFTLDASPISPAGATGNVDATMSNTSRSQIGMLLGVQGSASTVPGAVSDLSGTAGDGQVVLTHTAPDTGGAAITDYVYQYRPVP